MTIQPKYAKQPREPKKEKGEFDQNAVALIWGRDRGLCVFCGRPLVFGERGQSWSVHHRRPRGAGGTSVSWVGKPANGVVLCGTGTTGCHRLVEAHREESTRLGFLVSLLGSRRAAKIRLKHHLHGWVFLDDEGGWTRAEEPLYGEKAVA